MSRAGAKWTLWSSAERQHAALWPRTSIASDELLRGVPYQLGKRHINKWWCHFKQEDGNCKQLSEFLKRFCFYRPASDAGASAVFCLSFFIHIQPWAPSWRVDLTWRMLCGGLKQRPLLRGSTAVDAFGASQRLTAWSSPFSWLQPPRPRALRLVNGLL